MTARIVLPVACVLLASLAACGSKAPPFTLYRNEGIGDDSTRVHMATFDADETGQFNTDNCERARELFQIQPTNRARYWCEPGRYRAKMK